jgi:pyridoxamine 5'-phosphate oxidase
MTTTSGPNGSNQAAGANLSQSADPLALFHQWLTEATAAEPNDPTAAALATATPAGHPSVRMILLKPTGHHPFAFYTNSHSQKGHELSQNPHAALCLHWKSLRRQLRVEGLIHPLTPEASDRYFHSRSRNSQIAAAISQQSRTLSSREQLESEFRDFAARHPHEISRPDHWQGFYIEPEKIEFWLDGPDRLHDRFLFTRTNQSEWQKSRLYP